MRALPGTVGRAGLALHIDSVHSADVEQLAEDGVRRHRTWGRVGGTSASGRTVPPRRSWGAQHPHPVYLSHPLNPALQARSGNKAESPGGACHTDVSRFQGSAQGSARDECCGLSAHENPCTFTPHTLRPLTASTGAWWGRGEGDLPNSLGSKEQYMSCGKLLCHSSRESHIDLLGCFCRLKPHFPARWTLLQALLYGFPGPGGRM